MERQDLDTRRIEQSLEAGNQSLEMGKRSLAAAEKAKEDEETYLNILSENRRNPSAVIEALHDAGMPARADDYYQGLLKNRQFAADAGKAETEEAAAKFRNVAELFQGFLENTPEGERGQCIPSSEATGGGIPWSHWPAHLGATSRNPRPSHVPVHARPGCQVD